MTDPFIIMCAPNGARRSKKDHPNIPISPDELADCAEEILAAGASILHLHVRDKKGGHSLDADRYRAAIDAVRVRVGERLIIQVTTEAVGIYSRADQIALVKELRPEAVSLALREICPDVSLEADTADFFVWLQRNRIFPQIILYDQKDAEQFERMRRLGMFASEAPFVLYVLGKYGEEDLSNPHTLHKFSKVFANGTVPWAVCGFGKQEHNLSASVARLGGHVRVGFENNIWSTDNSLAASNGELVLAAKKTALAQGKNVASADDVRRMFALI